MKYLVNKETKEHKVATDRAVEAMNSHPDFLAEFQLVEADADGWIPWNGGECPLPPDGECVVKDRHTLTRGCGGEFSWRHEESNAHGSEWNIVAYRPILAEKEEVVCEMQPASVFDRLNQATEAAESIPVILAEINALLPDGYCVTKREAEHPAEDMSDWEKWSPGDLLECTIEKPHYLTLNRHYTMAGREYGYVILAQDDSRTTEGRFDPNRFRFHSRPVKS